jgi:hypothetical protein
MNPAVQTESHPENLGTFAFVTSVTQTRIGNRIEHREFMALESAQIERTFDRFSLAGSVFAIAFGEFRPESSPYRRLTKMKTSASAERIDSEAHSLGAISFELKFPHFFKRFRQHLRLHTDSGLLSASAGASAQNGTRKSVDVA